MFVLQMFIIMYYKVTMLKVLCYKVCI